MSEIAIVGIGSLFPGAAGTEAFWNNIVTGVDSITEVPASRWEQSSYYREGSFDDQPAADRFYCRRGGFVDDLATFDPLPFGVMPSTVEGTEPDQLLALRTAAEAIADLGGEAALPDRSKIGVIIGRGGYITPGNARLEQQVRTAHQLTSVLAELIPTMSREQLASVRTAFQKELGPSRPEESIGLVPNFAASRIANRLDFRGPAYTVDAACASSLVAVDSALRELESGRCDLVLTGGVHHCDVAILWSVFSQLKALSRSQQIRPFDRRADGTLMSEGTGIVALKRLEDARQAGDRIYAVIRGVGLASDGRASSLMSPLADGQVPAIERAWQMAGMDPREPGSIGLLEIHGTATPAGDRTELETITRVFGPRNGHAPPGVGTVKSMIGHAMPASGIAGLIKAALAVHHGVLPPTLHIEEPRPELERSRFRPILAAEPWDSGPRRAGINAFGFGGINAHVVIEAAEQPVRPRRSSPNEQILLLAGSTEEILAGLTNPRAGAVPGGGPCRLAIVDPDERKLTLARKIVAKSQPWRGRSDIWFTPSPLVPAGGKIALLFPGIVAGIDPQLGDLASQLGLPAPHLSGSLRTMEHTRDMMEIGLYLHRALGELGLRADAVAGHSLGEWSAMIASGMCEAESLEAFAGLLAPTEASRPDLKHVALGCPRETVAAALEGIDGIFVTHDNCPHQTVVCGRPDRVDALVAELGVITQELPFEVAFHTPLLAPHLDPERTRESLKVRAALTPVWSATTVEPYPSDPAAIVDLVFRHLVEPVRFGPLTRRLYAEGFRVFVEAGPGSLAGFVGDGLKGSHILATHAGTSGRSGLGQLRRAASALWVEGAPIDIARLLPAPDRSIRLKLGSPIVKLNGSATLFRSALRPPVQVTNLPDDPVAKELSALLAEATSAGLAIAEAWRTPPPSPPETEREFSLQTMPYLRDHCLVSQPPDWPDLSDRLPVVPMTTLLEVMAETASKVMPGKVVTGFRDVHARRWLVAEPPTTLTVKTAVNGDGSVRVTLGEHADGVVLLSDAYPPPPDPPRFDLSDLRPAPVPAGSLYEDGWMFHGPRFAGVTNIGDIGSDGLTGQVRALPTPGATLDSAGQLIGHWAQATLTTDRNVLPAGIDAVDLYGPLPTGRLVECSVRIRTIAPTAMAADAELVAGGTVWCRLSGWTTRRFSTDDRIWAVQTRPATELLPVVQPGGWMLLREAWSDVGTRNLMMFRYLNAAERAEYHAQNPRRQQEWLLGRIAAKDAVRNRLWERGHGPLYPCEVTISNDAYGKPIATGRFEAPEISISHKRGVAVAMAARGPVGIDIESSPLPEAGDFMFTPRERALLNGLPGLPGESWPARFWCAKEAASKAAGTGLMGLPRSFEVTDVEGEILTVSSSRTTRVATRALQSGHVAAWTIDEGDGL